MIQPTLLHPPGLHQPQKVDMAKQRSTTKTMVPAKSNPKTKAKSKAKAKPKARSRRWNFSRQDAEVQDFMNTTFQEHHTLEWYMNLGMISMQADFLLCNVTICSTHSLQTQVLSSSQAHPDTPSSWDRP